MASGASTVRGCSPPASRPESIRTEEEEDKLADGQAAAIKLREHVRLLKAELARGARHKENSGLVHRGTLSRSPPTQNVHVRAFTCTAFRLESDTEADRFCCSSR